MSKYIDVDKLNAGIERQQRKLILLSNTEQVDVRRDCALQNGVYSYVLDLINSLQREHPEVDLEKEIEECFPESAFYTGWNYDDMIEVARHFYELGLNARKEE